MFLFALFALCVCQNLEYETCKMDPLKDTPFCDTSLPYHSRITDVLTRIKLAEKIQMMDHTSSGVDRLKINPYQWWQEALHGLAFSPGANFTGDAKYATSFPQVTNLGRSFNMGLVDQIAHAISDEARALANLKQGFLSFWAPNVNIFRDPRWGRGHETPGEDPYLSAQYAVHYVTGMQEGEDERYLKTLPCCKHYTAYDLEDWHGIDRYHFDAIVSDQDMEETFQVPFRACVEDGHAKQVMCSYNSENGVPSCANELYQNYYMRDLWGFDGHVVSDCGAINAIFADHKYKPSEEETCEVALKHGCDLCCGSFYGKHLQSAVDKGVLKEADIDVALYRLFENRLRLGEYDPWEKQYYRSIPKTMLNSKEHQDLAYLAAKESMTLLKNQNDVLPIDTTSVASIAVIGPNAKATKTLLGNYYGPAPYIVSVFDGISKRTEVKVSYSKGCDVNSDDKSHFTEAKQLAATNDLTILVMGIDTSIENEMNDRDEISFPGVQEDLIELIAQSAKGPVILVMVAGGQIDISAAKKSVSAILWAGYPAQSGGDAVADVLFGDYNPAGLLAYTIYPASYTKQCEFTDMNMRPHKACPGRSYKFYNSTPVYAFGDGLSYTTFKFEWEDSSSPVVVSKDEMKEDVHFRVKVTNTGKKDGDVVVLAFVTNTFNFDAPLKELFGFERIHLKTGESQEVFFGLTQKNLMYVNKSGERELQSGRYRIQIGDVSKDVIVQ